MNLLIRLILFFPIISLASGVCDECEPLAEVSLTNSGLEKILTKKVEDQLKSINHILINKSSFRDVSIDRSQCPVQNLSTAIKGSKCYGLIDIPDDQKISGQTQLRPYKADVKDMKLTDLSVSLASPIKCANLKCAIEVKVDSLQINGNIEVTYSDKNKEIFIPKNDFKITTTKNAKFTFSGEAFLNPNEQKIDQLVFLKDEATKASLSPGSLNVDLALIKPFPNLETEIKMYAESYRKYFKSKELGQDSVDKQFMEYYSHRVFRTSVTDESIPKGSIKERELAAQKIVNTQIEREYGSLENLKKKMFQISWPNENDDNSIYQFMKNPPKEISFYTAAQQQIEQAQLSAIALNSGFKNLQAMQFAAIGVAAANGIGGDHYINDTVILPLLNKEVVPNINQQLNAELRKLSVYWNQLSKVPALSQNRQSASWLPLETEILVDQNTRNNKLLKFQLNQPNNNCSSYPKRFSEDDDSDFDFRTLIGPRAIQEYFDVLAKNNKLEFCLGDISATGTCADSKIKVLKAPKISCVNGEYQIDFDSNISKALFNADVQTKVRTTISSCSGSPCFQFNDPSGQLKNIFLNTFFKGLLEKSLTNAAQDGSNKPLNVPYVNLKHSKTDSNCNSKLDWILKE